MGMVFCVISQGSVIASGTLTFQPNFSDLTAGRMLCIALANGLAYGSLAFTLFPSQELAKCDMERTHFTCGHFNPAVTLFAYAMKEINGGLACMYLVGQSFGACMASLVLVNVIADAKNSELGLPVLSSGVNYPRGIFMEAFLTFFILFVLYVLVILRRNSAFVRAMSPLVLSFAYTAATFTGMAVTGACMNPFRALGPAIVSSTWTFQAVFWVGPLLGALLCAAVVSMIPIPDGLGGHKTVEAPGTVELNVENGKETGSE